MKRGIETSALPKMRLPNQSVRARIRIFMLLAITITTSDCARINANKPENRNQPSEKTEIQTPSEKSEAGLPLTGLQKQLLQTNIYPVFDEESGNILCGKNVSKIGAKFEKVTLDGITFRVRRKADILEDEKMVEIQLCGITKKFRKEFADLLQNTQDEMKADYLKYQSGKGNREWRAKYKRRMIAFSDNGPIDCIDPDDSFRTNEEQNNGYHLSFTGKNKYGRSKQKYKVALACTSAHEAGFALDVKNWEAAERYMWKNGIKGGDRGIEKDRRHFGIKEYKNGEPIRKNKNVCRHK
jgi:hypothetical protein